MAFVTDIITLCCGEVTPEPPKPKPETNNNDKEVKEKENNSMTVRIETLTIQEDVKEGEAEDDEGLTIYPYERLKTTSTNPVSDIDVTKREVILEQFVST